MRAKHGSQILKFQHPSGGFPKLRPFKPFENPEGFDQEIYNNLAAFPKEINWQSNSYMEANEIPTPKLDATDIPLSNSNLSWTPETPQLYQNTSQPQASKLDMQFETPEGFPEYLKSMSDFNVTMGNFMKDLRGNKFTYNPGFQRKTSLQKNFLQKAAGGIGNFVKNNPQLVKNGLNVGYEFLTDYFRKGVYNNKGSQLILDGAQTVGNLIPAVKPFALALEGINKMLGEHANPYHTDKNLRAKMATSYKDSYQFLDKAEQDANKFYGFLSTGSRQNANKHSRQAQGIEQNIRNIRNKYEDQLASVNELAYQRYADQINGIFTNPLAFAQHVKQGGKLQDRINLVKSRKFNQVINVDTKQVEEFKEGGVIQSEWKPVIEDLWEPIIEIPEFQEGGKIRTLEELIKYAKEQNPRFIQRFSEEPRGIKFIDDEGNEAEGSHYLESRGEYVIPRIQEINGELKFLNGHDAIDRAIESGNYLKMLPEEAIIFAENYKQGWPEFFEKFKEGGKTKEELETPEIEETNQKNLIPEGALHKNKHHMEHTEGLTQKGIPVIDNDGEQQAEIELDEIIFTLEVTKKLEELYKEGTDEAAIEAGKLLVKEILFNTDDRTGLIAKCEKGGTL